jgi:UDP-glucose 4-epimerase
VTLINEAVRNGTKCFVFTSSIAVYGKGQVPMNEGQSPLPEDPYGISKLAAELDLRAAHESYGMSYIVFRPHNVYGEHQNLGDPYRNVLGIFMNQILTERPMTIFGDGTQSRAFSHIDDVAPHIARSVHLPEAYNQVVNIGADRPYAVSELADIVARAMGISPNVQYLSARNEVLHAYASHEKARSLFGNTSTVPLEQGVQRMAEGSPCRSRKSRPFQNIELPVNMPPTWAALWRNRRIGPR